MDKHIFSRWQAALCTLFVLADGLYLSGIGWLPLLCSAVVSAALLFVLLKLPGKLLDAVCAVLALLLTLRSISRIFFFWQYEGTQAALAVVLLVLTAWLLSRRGADCLFILHLVGVAHELGHLLSNVYAVFVAAGDLIELLDLPGRVLDGLPHGALCDLVAPMVRCLQLALKVLLKCNELCPVVWRLRIGDIVQQRRLLGPEKFHGPLHHAHTIVGYTFHRVPS